MTARDSKAKRHMCLNDLKSGLSSQHGVKSTNSVWLCTSTPRCASRGAQHGLDVGHGGVVQQHVDVLVPRQLQQLDGLTLPSHPAAALGGALQVDRAVPVTHHHAHGLRIGELVRVAVGLGRGHAAAVQAVDGHPGRGQVRDQRLCVLPYLPALCETHVREEALVVRHGVVVGGSLDEDLGVGGCFGGEGREENVRGCFFLGGTRKVTLWCWLFEVQLLQGNRHVIL